MKERISRNALSSIDIPKVPAVLDRLGSMLDVAIYSIAPGWGDKRMRTRQRRQLVNRQIEKLGHPTMHPSVSRDGRFIATRQSTDEQLLESLVDMQYRSREMIATNPHAAGAVEGRVAHEIGVGLACRPEIEAGNGISEETAREANRRLSNVCRRWSDHGVDRQRQYSLSAVQRIMQRTYATYGECFVLLREAPFQGPIGLTVEIINPMRCETPPKYASDKNVQMGIRYHGRTGQILGYYFRTIDKLHRSRWSVKYEYISRYDSAGMQRCCHIHEALLPDQSRGLPWLMAGYPFLKDIDDFHEAELLGKQVEACLGVIIQGGGGQENAPAVVAEGNSSGRDEKGNRIEELYPASVQYTDSDGEIKVIDPSRPGGNFAPFIECGLRAVAAAGNYPYELLAKNFMRVTYSSGRLSMLDGKLGFDMRREPTIHMAMRPMWRRLISDAFFHGEMEGLASTVSYLADRSPWERHSWGGESFGAVDPEKQKKANKIGLETGESNLAMIAAEENRHWRDTMSQRDEERREQIRLDVAREVYERELRAAAGLPMPGEDPEGDGSDDPLTETDDIPENQMEPAA